MSKGKSIYQSPILPLLLVGILLCLSITSPPWESYQNWRQSDTLAMAENFSKDPRILFPQLNYDGPQGNYVQLELQILPYLTYLIRQWTGSSSVIIPRLLAICFFLCSMVYVYYLARALYSPRTAFYTMLLYGLTPLHLKLGRAIMPEAVVLCFFTGSLYYLKRFEDQERGRDLLLCGLFTALAILEKTPAVFTGLLILSVLWRLYRWKLFAKPVVYVSALLALGLPALYFYDVGQHAQQAFVNNIALRLILPRLGSLAHFTDGNAFLIGEWATSFGLITGVLGLAGFVLCLARRDHFMVALTIAYVLELWIIVYAIQFDYYLIFQTTVWVLLVGALFEALSQGGQRLSWLLTLLVLAQGALSIPHYRQAVAVNPVTDASVHALQQALPPGEPIAITATNPVLMNAVHAQGYRAAIYYHPEIPDDPKGEVDYMIDHGVRYFVAVKAHDSRYDEAYQYYLDQTYPIVEDNIYYTLYGLEP